MGRCRPCCFGAVVIVPLASVLVGLAWYQWPHRISCGEMWKWCLDDLIQLTPDEGVDYCKLKGNGKLSVDDFMTKGYTVVSDWLPKDAIKKLLEIREAIGDVQDSAPGKNGGSTPGYRIPEMFGIDVFNEVPILGQLIHEAKEVIEKDSDVRISEGQEPYHRNALLFHTNVSEANSMMFGWHQDIENLFLFNDLYHYLDFYVMLDKPDPNEAGVMMVPFDGLKARARKLYDLVHGAGSSHGAPAASFNQVAPNASQIDLSNDGVWGALFSMDTLSCSPTLAAGDLLLFRGDAIHRTQPHNSHRTSLNVNVNPITADPVLLLSGGMWKSKWMHMSPGQYVGTAYKNTDNKVLGALRSIGIPNQVSLGFAIHAKYYYNRAMFGVRSVIQSTGK